jgi:hypothetical protein
VRILHDVSEIAHRLRGDLRGLTAAQKLGGCMKGRQPRHLAIQEGEVHRPELSACEPFVIKKARILQYVENPRPSRIGIGDDTYIAVRGWRGLPVWIDLAKISDRRVWRINVRPPRCSSSMKLVNASNIGISTRCPWPVLNL